MEDHGVTPSSPLAHGDQQVAVTINQVLEYERGSVLALVQLAAMATEALERQALVVAGGQAAQACIELHAVLVRQGADVSEQAGDAASVVQELERIDDRYTTFAELQQRMMTLIEAIPRSGLDAATLAALAMAHTVQAAHAAWALQRAHDFAASREAALLAATRPPDDLIPVSPDLDRGQSAASLDGGREAAVPEGATLGGQRASVVLASDALEHLPPQPIDSDTLPASSDPSLVQRDGGDGSG